MSQFTQDSYGPPWEEAKRSQPGSVENRSRYGERTLAQKLLQNTERILTEIKEQEKRLNHIEQQLQFIKEEKNSRLKALCETLWQSCDRIDTETETEYNQLLKEMSK